MGPDRDVDRKYPMSKEDAARVWNDRVTEFGETK